MDANGHEQGPKSPAGLRPFVKALKINHEWIRLRCATANGPVIDKLWRTGSEWTQIGAQESRRVEAVRERFEINREWTRIRAEESCRLEAVRRMLHG
jgi:hypothetical protein